LPCAPHSPGVSCAELLFRHRKHPFGGSARIVQRQPHGEARRGHPGCRRPLPKAASACSLSNVQAHTCPTAAVRPFLGYCVLFIMSGASPPFYPVRNAYSSTSVVLCNILD
jgi:hypothetical protein